MSTPVDCNKLYIYNIYLEQPLKSLYKDKHSKSPKRDFPGGAVNKNLSATAGDMASVPALGRSHMLWGNQDHVPQLLSLCSRACLSFNY